MDKSQILFVRAKVEDQSTILNRTPYWSAGLSIVLEKHGFLSIDEVEPEALLDLSMLCQYAAVLVARLPDHWWDEDKINALFRSRVQIFLEGPLPDLVLKALAITSHEPRWKEGVVSVIDESVFDLANAYGYGVGGSLKASMPLYFSRRPDGMEWGLAQECPITLRQSAAWALTPWSFTPWRVREGPSRSSVIAELVGEKNDRLPVIVRRHTICASCFDIFSLLVWHHTAEPLPVDTYRAPERIIGIEAILLGLIDDMIKRSNKPRIRVMPWPAGIDWVLNVRHDFDRPISVQRMAAVLGAHATHQTRATWYWRESTADSEIMKMAMDAEHEIALHTEKVFFGGEKERKTVESEGQSHIKGTTAHGGHTSFRFQGAPNVYWAMQQGCDYVEIASRKNIHPHFFAWLTENGLVIKKDIVCLPRHVSVDTGPRDGQSDPDSVLRQAETFIKSGGFLQVMNHPDINLPALSEILDKFPTSARANWCAMDMAVWWKKTHDRARLRYWLKPVSNDIQIEADCVVNGLVFELLLPEGGRSYATLEHLDGNAEIKVSQFIQKSQMASFVSAPQVTKPEPSKSDSTHAMLDAETKGDSALSWEAVQNKMRDAIRNYYISVKTDPESASAKSTIRTNTELVKARGTMLQNFVKELTGNNGNFLRGRDVLEVGSGFGALGLFFATVGESRTVTGIDVRDDFIELSQKVANDLGIGEKISYEVMDMRDLKKFGDDSFDVIVCNNSLYYIPSRKGIAEALKQFRRILRKDGKLVIYQANRWRYRDAFTKAPLVHLMPALLADFVCKKTGLTHSHGRVEFISPIDLRLRLRKAGFEDVSQCGNHRSKAVFGIRGMFTDFFCSVAK